MRDETELQILIRCGVLLDFFPHSITPNVPQGFGSAVWIRSFTKI